jgi:SAM-dependent methyltransferase
MQDAAMPLTPNELDHLTASTLAHYDTHAEDYWQGTRDHDVSQNIATLLRHIQRPAPLRILDLGCGPGRDLKTFSELGHHAIGLEGAPQVAALARSHSGCVVWQQNLLALDLPAAEFDGVFANAVLFHVPSAELARVLLELHATLKPGGVLFSSNPRGQGQEGWQGERFGAFHDLATWRRCVVAAGFVELEHYFRPDGLPCEQQPWLASAWRVV